MRYRSVIGWVLLSVALLALPASAAEYRLQITHLDYLNFSNFSAHLENSSTGRRGEERMARLEGRLDRREFPPAAVIPGREVQLLEDPGYGGKSPARLSLLPATRA
jgi:hypothetical protein